MLELPLQLTSDQALARCRRLGLVVTSERELAGRGGGDWAEDLARELAQAPGISPRPARPSAG